MMIEKPRQRGLLAGMLLGTWHVINGLRKAVLNVLFLVLVLALAAAWWASRSGAVKARSVLVLNLDGAIVEQRSANLRDAALSRLQGGSTGQTVLRDVLRALDHAAHDKSITAVLLQTDKLTGGGLPTQRELAAAITRFRASGKKVVAWALHYDQRAYYLAAHADEVYLHPMGAVFIEGYGRRRNYYRDALDRLGIQANVVRVGMFKNAAEPFFANAPSAETLESEGELYRGLWALYADGVEKARRLPAGHVARLIDGLPENLVAAGGDPARLADLKLVDGLMTPDALRTLLIDRGAKDESSKSFRQVNLAQYMGRARSAADGDAVGVVVAEGAIVDGEAPAGTVGGFTTAELLRKAREDDSVKAVVLRVDSPGGSALASELIRREMQLTRAAGKPVVVSMGDLAASGGYWISMAADEIIADPATITGSIGVFGMLPTAQGLMDKLSVSSGGTATTWLADAYDVRKPLDPRFVKLVQSAIGHVYGDFTAKAAAARKTTREKIEAVAQGRIWSGERARDKGLVDRLGNLSDALAAARTRARLPPEARVTYMTPEGGRLERLLHWFDATLGPIPGLVPEGWPGQAAGNGLPASPAFDQAREELQWFARMAEHRDPFSAIVHCLCGMGD